MSRRLLASAEMRLLSYIKDAARIFSELPNVTGDDSRTEEIEKFENTARDLSEFVLRRLDQRVIEEEKLEEEKIEKDGSIADEDAIVRAVDTVFSKKPRDGRNEGRDCNV